MWRYLIVVLLLAGCAVVPVKTLSKTERSIVFAGDSLTSGAETIEQQMADLAAEHCAQFGRKAQLHERRTNGRRYWTSTYHCVE